MKNIILLIMTMLAPVAFAGSDSEGQIGRLIGLSIYDDDSNSYLNNHLRLTVMEGVDGLGNPLTMTYVSEGTTCQSKGISPQNYAVLQTAMVEKNIRIRPYYVPGLGNSRCIVAFDLIQMPQFESVVP